MGRGVCINYKDSAKLLHGILFPNSLFNGDYSNLYLISKRKLDKIYIEDKTKIITGDLMIILIVINDYLKMYIHESYGYKSFYNKIMNNILNIFLRIDSLTSANIILSLKLKITPNQNIDEIYLSTIKTAKDYISLEFNNETAILANENLINFFNENTFGIYHEGISIDKYLSIGKNGVTNMYILEMLSEIYYKINIQEMEIDNQCIKTTNVMDKYFIKTYDEIENKYCHKMDPKYFDKENLHQIFTKNTLSTEPTKLTNKQKNILQDQAILEKLKYDQKIINKMWFTYVH